MRAPGLRRAIGPFHAPRSIQSRRRIAGWPRGGAAAPVRARDVQLRPISASGCSTKARRCSAWVRQRQFGAAISAWPCSSRSRSSVRGALRIRALAAEAPVSIACSAMQQGQRIERGVDLGHGVHIVRAAGSRSARCGTSTRRRSLATPGHAASAAKAASSCARARRPGYRTETHVGERTGQRDSIDVQCPAGGWAAPPVRAATLPEGLRDAGGACAAHRPPLVPPAPAASGFFGRGTAVDAARRPARPPLHARVGSSRAPPRAAPRAPRRCRARSPPTIRPARRRPRRNRPAGAGSRSRPGSAAARPASRGRARRCGVRSAAASARSRACRRPACRGRRCRRCARRTRRRSPGCSAGIGVLALRARSFPADRARRARACRRA